jgi:hypothetical protein
MESEQRDCEVIVGVDVDVTSAMLWAVKDKRTMRKTIAFGEKQTQ